MLGVSLVALVTVTSVAAAYLSVIRWWGALLVVGVLAWFMAWGVAVARKLMSSQESGAHWLFGPVWGVGLALVGLLVIWWFGGRGLWVVALAPWPLGLLLVLPLGRFGIDLHPPRFDRSDLVAVLLLFVLVPVIAGPPYAHVAELVDDGAKAYRAYFTADFVWAMTVVAEVSKGDVPPKNPFQTNGTLNYYWLAHFLSSVEYRIAGPWGLGIEEVTLANSLAYSLAFVAFLYGLARMFGGGTWAAAGACAMVFLANSFEALDRIWEGWGQPIVGSLSVINLDAVTRWFYSGMPVDGLHRMFLYQPHHLGGYAIGLSALLIVGRASKPGRPMVALATGSFLALSLLLTSFTAIIIGVTVSLVYGVRLLTARLWTAIPVCAVLGALPVLIAARASQVLGYVNPDATTLVIFGPNPVALMHWPYALLLSFGPLLILGALGMFVTAVRREWNAWPMAMLVAVALFFYFMTDVPDMQHVWVGWRAGHLLFVALTVFTAILLSVLHQSPVGLRLAAWPMVAVLVVVALPTVAFDIYNAQDVTNRRAGPGFPWTLVLSKGEVEALGWLKTHTPPGVVVQPNSAERANASWGYIPAFGERRMAAGLPIAMIPLQPYIDQSDWVAANIFNEADPLKRLSAARKMRIDYLYVGPAEREGHPELVSLLDARSDLFPAVFRNQDVVIYWVVP